MEAQFYLTVSLLKYLTMKNSTIFSFSCLSNYPISKCISVYCRYHTKMQHQTFLIALGITHHSQMQQDLLAQSLNMREDFISVWEINMLDERATILQTISDQAYGVSDLIKKLRFRSEKIVSLLKAMKREGLIDFSAHSNNSTLKGRPKKIPIVTALGKEMLKDYVKCKRNIIQINDNDIKSSIHQISLRKTLEEKNVSLYRRFFELNDIAFRIKNSITH